MVQQEDTRIVSDAISGCQAIHQRADQGADWEIDQPVDRVGDRSDRMRGKKKNGEAARRERVVSGEMRRRAYGAIRDLVHSTGL